MEKEFIPYEQAKELKELGYNKPCFAITNNGPLFYGEFKDTHEYYKEHGQILYQQAFDWFREEFNIHVMSSVKLKDSEWVCRIADLSTGELVDVAVKDTFESTRLEGVKVTINYLKSIKKK